MTLSVGSRSMTTTTASARSCRMAGAVPGPPPGRWRRRRTDRPLADVLLRAAGRGPPRHRGRATGAGAVHGSPGDVTPPARRRVRA